jgi:RimJ/RimL family protein N-acetyltransferase/8-oxo-dGTP pyrophosphatase MutT (NUDIX family)
VAEQRTLTDGVITLRPWQHDDLEAARTALDDEAALWLGTREVIPSGDPGDASGPAFVVEHDGTPVGAVSLVPTGDGVAMMRWLLYADHRGRGHAARALRVLVDWALSDPDQGGLGLQRVEAHIDPRHSRALRAATRAGLHREGEQRLVPGMGARADATRSVVYARLATDPPLSDPASFRSLLNSFLPRKRAIGQVLIRDTEQRVLLCQLTYKRDWDLPGGVVEVGESPRLAAFREVEEELGLSLPVGDLLLTDWLPPWGGWDDAVCLVFDGGIHESSLVDRIVKQAREIRDARFCTLDEIDERAADFTARRIRAALANRPLAYTESGR